jgi:hypothetical protein
MEAARTAQDTVGFDVDEVRVAIAYWMEREPCTDGFSLSRTVSLLADVYGEMIAIGARFVPLEKVPEETRSFLRQAGANEK